MRSRTSAKAPNTYRLSIRASVYRGQPGFLIYGSGPGFGTKVFCTTREQAERARDNINAGRRAFDKENPT